MLDIHQFDLWEYNSSSDPLETLDTTFATHWRLLIGVERVAPRTIRITHAGLPSYRFWQAIRAISGIGGVIDGPSYLRDIDARLYTIDGHLDYKQGDLIMVKSFKSAFLLRSGYFFCEEEGQYCCHIVIHNKMQRLIFQPHEIHKLREL